MDSEVYAEVRADLAYARTKCHPSPHTHCRPTCLLSLTPPSHYYLIDYYICTSRVATKQTNKHSELNIYIDYIIIVIIIYTYMLYVVPEVPPQHMWDRDNIVIARNKGALSTAAGTIASCGMHQYMYIEDLPACYRCMVGDGESEQHV